MTRFERAFGILLALADGRMATAAALAERFEVSVRTIYRDVEMLSATGVPIYAERGAAGGYRLLEGYFLPPVAFTREEAVAGLLALALARGMAAPPFPAALESAERKLVAALPDRLRPLLAETRRLVGFERAAADLFHPEPPQPPGADAAASHAVEVFMKGALDGTRVRLVYRVPYRDGTAPEADVEPQGLLWDRDLWYLIGRRVEADGRRVERFWRADRVRAIQPSTMRFTPDRGFDVRRHLGRAWLGKAMAEWAGRSPVVIRMRPEQAARLSRDWMFGFARFEPDGNSVRMTWGEVEAANALELVRWLGPGAELLSPAEWRDRLRDEAAAIAAAHG